METTALVYPYNGILLSNEENELLVHSRTWIHLIMLHSAKEDSEKIIHSAWFHWNKLLGNANKSMWWKKESSSPEDRWEVQREGRRVDIREIPDLDDCGDNFMGVYIYQNGSDSIIYFFNFLEFKV